MIDFDFANIVGARVLVAGFGIAGQGAYSLAVSLGAEVSVFEDGRNAPGPLVTTYADAAELPAVLDSFDLVIVSPGIAPSHPVFARPEHTISELGFARHFISAPVIAITGTNGKTTVTVLVTEMLNRAGISALAVGNIGVPLSAHVAKPPAVFVLEASSFQLAYTDSLAPAQAAFLNFSPDHLDWHQSLGAYLDAKARIVTGIEPAAPIWIPANQPGIAEALASKSAQLRTVPGEFARVEGDWVVLGESEIVRVDELTRRFSHDLGNFCFAGAMASHQGADLESIAATMAEFRGLAHRMEYLGVVRGHPIYNDSKATTPDAVVADLGGIASAVLIAGGKPKGLDLAPLAGIADRVSSVVAIGEAAAAVAEVFRGVGVPVSIGRDMADAVARAFEQARGQDAIVLSPGCTSWDWYSSYVERGLEFVAEIDRYRSK